MAVIFSNKKSREGLGEALDYIPNFAKVIAENKISLLEVLWTFKEQLMQQQAEVWNQSWGVRREQLGKWERWTLRELQDCLDEIRDVNCRISELQSAESGYNWRVDEECVPGIALRDAEDYILYWYVNGEFPVDMERGDIERVVRELRDRHGAHRKDEELVRMISDWDAALWDYRRKLMERQLEELQKLMAQRILDDFDGVRMDANQTEEACTLPSILWTPIEPGKPEGLTMEELISEIEEQECVLSGLELEEFGKDGLDEDPYWHELYGHTHGLLKELQEQLQLQLNERLSSYKDVQLRPEDVLASWYLDRHFPTDLSYAEMMAVERLLLDQLSTLEEAEADYANADKLGLWQYRCDLKGEQHNEIRDIIRRYEPDSETWMEAEKAEED